MIIYLAKKTQIALLLVKKIIILAKYLDSANIFSKKLAKMLLEQTRANENTIILEKGKKSSYRAIYSLKPI